MTRVDGTFVDVALRTVETAFAIFDALVPPMVLTTFALCVPLTSPLRFPLKLVEVTAFVALEAFPFNVAVMMLAEKLPLISRETIEDDVDVLVALVAEFATFPLVVIVAILVSEIDAPGLISPSIRSDVDRLPLLSV